MEKIRVLHSELNGELGGIESFLYNLDNFMDKDKVVFDFLTTSSNPAYGEQLQKAGSKIYMVPSHYKFLEYRLAVKKILKEGKYDIVHIHKNSAIDILLLSVIKQFPDIKVIAHSHNTFPSIGGKFQKLHYINRKILYKNTDCHLACSENAGRWMYGNGTFEIIRNGIDTNVFKYNTRDREEIRRRYGIGEDAFVVGHVGRFTIQKNHSELVDIFMCLKKAHENSYLMLIGCGELENTIRDKVKQLRLEDSVIFCGVRKDVSKYFCAMDAFVFPSIWEGLGIVAIEAQAAGLETYLSKEVPKEVEVTDAVKWFDNKTSADEIAKQIDVRKVPENIRNARNTDVMNCGYDMKESAVKLLQIYEKLKAGTYKGAMKQKSGV